MIFVKAPQEVSVKHAKENGKSMSLDQKENGAIYQTKHHDLNSSRIIHGVRELRKSQKKMMWKNMLKEYSWIQKRNR
jgi:hypothetical protein